MTTITKISDDKIQKLLAEYDSLGGVIDFKFFKVTSATGEKEAHLLTAQATLQELANDNDNYFFTLATQRGTKRDDYFKVVFNSDIGSTGIRITPEVFFGTHFNFKEQRPILLGRVGRPFQSVTVFSDYFYFDTEETSDNIVSIKSQPTSEFYKTDFVTQGYASAFLEPPHSFGSKKSLLELGNYFLDFNRKLFGDFYKMIIYSWSVECSNYFDAGKEWWGSYFWTVYNPSQDIYIGIAASATD